MNINSTNNKFWEDNNEFVGDSGGGNIFVDGLLSTTSTNPVQNKAITNAINPIASDVSDLKNDISVLVKETAFTDRTIFTNVGYLNGNGNYQANSAFLTSDYINIDGYTKITMTASTMDNLSNIVLFNANGDKVGKYTGSGSSALNTFNIDIPNTAKTARFSILATDNVNVQFQSELIPKRTIWLALGDSITYGYGNDGISYADYAAEKLGIVLNKQGVSGSTISAIYGRIANGDYDGIKPDIITILGGTNDWNTNRKSKNANTDTIYNANTYLAYVNTMIETLRAKQPQAHIIFLSCTQRNYFGTESGNLTGVTNGIGETLDDYRNALYIGCNMHGVPVIDLYSESGICGQNLLSEASGYSTPSVHLYTVDGLHPNKEGHRRIADVVAGKLLNFII